MDELSRASPGSKNDEAIIMDVSDRLYKRVSESSLSSISKTSPAAVLKRILHSQILWESTFATKHGYRSDDGVR